MSRFEHIILSYTQFTLYSNATIFTADPAQNRRLRLENDKLKSEIVRLKTLLENSTDGAVGGVDLSDSNSVGASSTDGGGVICGDRMEQELKLAKELISSELTFESPSFP